MPEMVSNGEVIRFCQQCGRFQPIADFEGSKKSCRNKLQMHNAQRKRAREKNQAAMKKRPRVQKSSPSPTPEPQTPTDRNVPVSPEVQMSIFEVHTPVQREASPALPEMLITTAAKAVHRPPPAIVLEAPSPALAAADGFDIAPLSFEEVDFLMDEFNSPLACQLSLSILEEVEERLQDGPENALLPELLYPYYYYCN
jgi:hypothetical protein